MLATRRARTGVDLGGPLGAGRRLVRTLRGGDLGDSGGLRSVGVCEF
jgi:hypothetical protein